MTKDQRVPPDAHQVLYSAKCQSSTCVNKDILCTALPEQQQQERFACERLCEAEEQREEQRVREAQVQGMLTESLCVRSVGR